MTATMTSIIREDAIAAWFRGVPNSWLAMTIEERVEATRRWRSGWRPGQFVPTIGGV